jgi:integrase
MTRGSASHFGAKSVPKMEAGMSGLTDAAIRAAKPNTTLWDTSLQGFGLRAGQKRKTFIVLIDSGRRQSIGPYGPGGLTLSQARTEARRILAEKTLGYIRPKHVAFADAREEYLKDCEMRLRPLTVRNYRYQLTRHYPFGRRGLADVTSRQIIKQLDTLNGRPSEKEHAHRTGRTFFKWCMQQHLIDRSPMENLRAPPVGRSRERVLSDDELTVVYRAAWNGNTPFHRLLCFLLLLGLRRSEAANLRWSWFDERTHTLTIPGEHTKNKRTLILPYGSVVSTLLGKIPRLSETYLFPAARQRVRGKPATIMTGFDKPKRDFEDECGVHDWVLHDCRRVIAVGLQKLGTRLEVIEALLNHVSGTRSGIVGVYQRYNYQPELKTAVQKWQEHLHALLSTTQGINT